MQYKVKIAYLSHRWIKPNDATSVTNAERMSKSYLPLFSSSVSVLLRGRHIDNDNVAANSNTEANPFISDGEKLQPR